jgi:glycerol-3-phosphate cytidylyltransferase-like family protein
MQKQHSKEGRNIRMERTVMNEENRNKRLSEYRILLEVVFPRETEQDEQLMNQTQKGAIAFGGK